MHKSPRNMSATIGTPKEPDLGRQEFRFGISPALVTPLTEDGYVDVPQLAAHADDLLGRGCSTATIFGTTGEGPSFSLSERDRTAAALIAEGFPAERLVEGIIACSVGEASEAVCKALARRTGAVLLAPPFYFRQAPDDAVFAWYSEVFARTGRNLRDIILYHIPSMTGVPLSFHVIARLRAAFPDAILGVKDSAGKPDETMQLIEAHGDLVILVGDETYLGRACAAGAQGSICGLANVVPEAVCAIAESGDDNPLIRALVEAIAPYPIAMLKALVGSIRRDVAWARICPPLLPVDAGAVRQLAPLVDALRARAAAPA
jgi:4-hydroxy-tetrahydrodipicolinate synthase